MCGERVTELLALMQENKKVELNPENQQRLRELLQLSIDSQEVSGWSISECAVHGLKLFSGMRCLLRTITQPSHHGLRTRLRRRMY